MGSLRAVIVYRSTHLLPRAHTWCAARGWDVEAVVPKDRFLDALQLIDEGRAQLIVAASADSLDPDRLPRVEIVPEGDDEVTGSSE